MININHLNPFSDNYELRNNLNNINVIIFISSGAPIKRSYSNLGHPNLGHPNLGHGGKKIVDRPSTGQVALHAILMGSQGVTVSVPLIRGPHLV